MANVFLIVKKLKVPGSSVTHNANGPAALQLEIFGVIC